MADIDPTKLRPTDVVRLLNSTPAGPVTNARKMKSHRERAGFRIGDGTTVDLFRYVAWMLAEKHHTPQPSADDAYKKHRERMAARAKTISAAGRDIGPLPPVVDPDRKSRAISSFREFCEAYMPGTFVLTWSDDHRRVIDKIETAVTDGGLFAMAMPRGSGKTSLAEAAALWSVLRGSSEFVAVVGANEAHAAGMLESMKVEIETNDTLAEDWPEVCHPIIRLEGMAQRCVGQLLNGERTHIGWTAKEIVLPTVPGSTASGAVVKVCGLTGQIRGMKFKRPDGQTVRPSLVIVDDPQTDESARSMSQCTTREQILAGAVLGLAGPGKKISGVMPCTVIRPDDMADRILDREKHPEWNGERTKMVYTFPKAEKMWEEYATIRADSLRAGEDGKAATEFYATNRDVMDEGSVVAWPERFNHDELSAIQHAMNLRIRDERAFWAEYQNEPMPAEDEDTEALTIDDICERLNGRRRRSIPITGHTVTAFVDIQDKCLFYLVAAWSQNFDGYVIDYGSWPDQRRGYYTLADMQNTLAKQFPGAGREARILGGLKGLADELNGREFEVEGSQTKRIDRILIDANWGESTEVVREFCRQTQFENIMPAHGRYVGATSRPMSEYRKVKGDRAGLNWRIPFKPGRTEVRHVLFDTNFWKSFIDQRLKVPLGDPGALSLWGRSRETHQMFAEQQTSEYRVRVEAYGRAIDEWKLRPGRDNHLLDCLVGSAVGASMQGCTLPSLGESSGSIARKRDRVKLSELKGRRR